MNRHGNPYSEPPVFGGLLRTFTRIVMPVRMNINDMRRALPTLDPMPWPLVGIEVIPAECLAFLPDGTAATTLNDVREATITIVDQNKVMLINRMPLAPLAWPVPPALVSTVRVQKLFHLRNVQTDLCFIERNSPPPGDILDLVINFIYAEYLDE